MSYPRLTAIGLMSGTSLDGLDICLADLHLSATLSFDIKGFRTYAMPVWLKEKIKRNLLPEQSSVLELCELNFELGEWFGGHTAVFLEELGVLPSEVDLIGSHGQTMYHIPPDGKAFPSTLQLGEPAVISARTGITTVADFRTADMAYGGQGAPLVPYIDQLLFPQPESGLALQNIGGISNVTYLSGDTVLAFDTGPGNMVMDQVVFELSQGKLNYDKDGKWAAQGAIEHSLLEKWLSHAYFSQVPPKSTGREVFGVDYALQCIQDGLSQGMSGADIIATVTALTAYSIARAYQDNLPDIPQEIVLSGGGANNLTLKAQLEQVLNQSVKTLESYGLSSDAREAFAFACLGYTSLLGAPNNLMAATGASQNVVSGKIIPGDNYLDLMKKVFCHV